MTFELMHNDRKYSTEGPYWNWKTDKGNIVTSQRLIKELEDAVLNSSRERFLLHHPDSEKFRELVVDTTM